MQALMGKSPKTPTPQELYHARKQREEEERDALLPPGLVNHGNTCFMNSVLQGLLATPMLADIVRFSLPESYSPILSYRSPQLTNGHGLGGMYEREWEQGMPLGDTFVILMYKAWKAQEEKCRSPMTPRELLNKIGTKYDQYQDFRQQDAHELLRHLLDAMRMEELDIIKKRQPIPPKSKRRRKPKALNGKSSQAGHMNGNSPVEEDDIPEDERLTSFVDMVFGGQLASILICEKCKKISCTMEDFNDLSLPIKQDEYEKGRNKRDRIKNIARKFGIRGRAAIRDLDIPEGPRSSSVPASPLRRSEEAEKSFEIVLNDTESRRRSLEHGESKPSLPSTTIEEVAVEDEKADSDGGKDEDKRLLTVDDESRDPEKEDGQKDEDGWVKLRRKISVGVKKTKKRHSKERQRGQLPSTIDELPSDTNPDETLDSFVDVKAPSPAQASPAASPRLGPTIGLPRFPFPRRPSRADAGSPALSTGTTPPCTPDVPPSSLPQINNSPSRPSTSSHSTHPGSKRDLKEKHNKSAKPARDESQYLRKLLADIPGQSSAPFNLFRNVPLTHSSPDISELRGSWPKSGSVQSIEGCLRMFTAVEVMDGENMVGCRRCWKIQNGKYNYRSGRQNDTDSDGGAEDEEGSTSSASVKISLAEADSSPLDEGNTASNSPRMSNLDLYYTSAKGSRTVNGYFPAPPAMQRSSSQTSSVPSISMTAPDSISSVSPSTNDTLAAMGYIGSFANHALSTDHQISTPTLGLPSRHTRMPAERGLSTRAMGSDTSDISSGESDDEPEGTESSLAASIQSESSVLSTGSAARPSDTEGLRSSDKGKGDKSNRAKEVIMRRAYKRYLIAKPPPVLVVHLKRFQQVGRSPSTYYSLSNLKKLEDPVSFSEYLDITPFLLPRRKDVESSGAGKEKSKDQTAKQQACVYRLYAVVVHIGNMLGGHYIAYVALPDRNEEQPNGSPSLSEKSSLSPDAEKHLNSQNRPSVSRAASFQKTANPPSQVHGKPRMSQSSNISSTQRQWCYVSDTTVRLASLEEVLQAKAYICMYEQLRPT